MKKALNTDIDGCALALVAGYYKFYAKTLFGWGGTSGTCVMEMVNSQGKRLIKRRRTEVEKIRRHHEGDKGATFSKSKEYYISDARISDTITTFLCKENLICEEMIDRPKGKGWIWSERENKWLRVRKLTPRSCFKLMGVRDSEADMLIGSGISETQLYKMAGNSIVVDVMDYCFENLFYPQNIKPTLF